LRERLLRSPLCDAPQLARDLFTLLHDACRQHGLVDY
jgi:hypothetical protein